MSKLLAVAEAVALEKLVLGNFPVSRKSKAGLGLVAFSALLALAATGFLIVAFHEWASLNYRADFAALLTALAVFGLSAAAGIGACLIMRQRRLNRETLKKDIQNNLQAAIATIDDELGDRIRENPTMAVLLAGLAGFVAADRIL